MLYVFVPMHSLSLSLSRFHLLWLDPTRDAYTVSFRTMQLRREELQALHSA